MWNVICCLRKSVAQATRAHNESYTLECAYVNPAFRGEFQVEPLRAFTSEAPLSYTYGQEFCGRTQQGVHVSGFDRGSEHQAESGPYRWEGFQFVWCALHDCGALTLRQIPIDV